MVGFDDQTRPVRGQRVEDALKELAVRRRCLLIRMKHDDTPSTV